MFEIRNMTGKALVLASVLALTGGVAMAERGEGPGDGDGARKHQRDGDGKRHRGERGERGEHGDRGPRGDRRAEMGKRLFGGMELNDDQKAQIQEIMKAHGEERKAWHEANKDQFQALREKMREAHKSDDQEAAQAVRDEIKALMESAPKPDASHDQIRALLSEEQQVTFDERVTKMRERMEQRKEGRGDGSPKGEHGMMGRDGKGKKKDGDKPRGARMFGNLDLDDEQKAQLRETMQSDQTREEKMAAVREMLNDDQKAQLDANIEKMKQYREEHKGKRGKRGGKRGDGPKDKDAGGSEGGDVEHLDL